MFPRRTLVSIVRQRTVACGLVRNTRSLFVPSRVVRDDSKIKTVLVGTQPARAAPRPSGVSSQPFVPKSQPIQSAVSRPVEPTKPTFRRPSFFKNPLSAAIHLVSDVVDATKDVVVGTIKLSGDLASDTVRETGRFVTPKLPQVKVPVPRLLHDATDLTGTVADTADELVKSSLSAVDGVGRATGRYVGSSLSSMTGRSASLENVDPDREETFVEETTSALRRLLGSSTTAFSESLDAVEHSTGNVLNAAAQTGVGLVSHTFGEDSGALVQKGVNVGRSSLKTFKTVKTFGARKALQIASKGAQQELLHSITASSPPKMPIAPQITENLQHRMDAMDQLDEEEPTKK